MQADATYSPYKRIRPSGDQLLAQMAPLLSDRSNSSSSPSPLASASRRLLLLNVKRMRLPSRDQIGDSAIPVPTVNRVAPRNAAAKYEDNAGQTRAIRYAWPSASWSTGGNR